MKTTTGTRGIAFVWIHEKDRGSLSVGIMLLAGVSMHVIYSPLSFFNCYTTEIIRHIQL